MKKLYASVALLLLAALLASCGNTKTTFIEIYHAKDYQWHKNTLGIKLHWDYLHPDDGTIVADGYVEPFNPSNGVHTVRLELVGLDKDGNVVNTASGMPRDNYIYHPLDESPFTISMKLNGSEKRFTIRGTYYYYNAGEIPDYSTSDIEYIPIDDTESR
ncbi:MAG: hypothetical protein HZA22_04430 [Nitrospirae bacterium]|nr:hypothetical protein [Nitrospirota bacterium]